MINDVHALPNQVLVKNMEFGERLTRGGIILLDDDGKEKGIHSRWAEVWRVGEGITDVKEGDWVLLDHGRWSRSFEITPTTGDKFKANRIDWPTAILIVSDEKPDIDNI